MCLGIIVLLVPVYIKNYDLLEQHSVDVLGTAWPPYTGLQKPTNGSVITFIISSTGRRSLHETIASIKSQTCRDWKIIVIFEGLEQEHADKFLIPRSILIPDHLLGDARIRFVNPPLRQTRGRCGSVRAKNVGLALADTPWVTFLDENVVISRHYIKMVQTNAESADLLIFRMYQYGNANSWSPPKDALDIDISRVGYSFAMKKMPRDVQLAESNLEPFDLLHRMCHYKLDCLILPHVTHYMGGKIMDSSDTLKATRRRVPKLRRLPVESIALMQNARFDCASNNALQGSIVKDVHPFFFTEASDDRFFGANIKALKKSLKVAISNGCLEDWNQQNSSERIHIIMQHLTQPASNRYVQVQFEQHTSRWFTPAYLDKLANATQIWELSTRGAKLLGERLPSTATKTFAMPTTVYLDDKRPQFVCAAHNRRPSGLVNVYEGGCYQTWRITGSQQKLEKFEAGSCKQSKCQIRAKYTTTSLRQDPVDVVFYGSIMCSDGNKREQMCDRLHARGIPAICLHVIFGPLLTHYVCNSRIIVLEHYYSRASLETHRIDALLLLGKVVVSTPSADPELDRAYSDYVIFSEPENIAETVQDVLANWHLFEHREDDRKARFMRWVRNRDPLCYALRNLNV